MSEDEIFSQANGAYLCLVHPVLRNDVYRQEIAPIIAFASTVPDQLVAAMVTGASWRERLLGLCLAMATWPTSFIEPMVQSLRDPRGIAIVPTCAALGVLARTGDFAMAPSFSEMFDRTAFDGELGWATDQAMRVAGLRTEDVSGRGPNYGQVFDDHVEVYTWIRAA